MSKLKDLFGRVKGLAFDTAVYGLANAVSRAVSILMLPFLTSVLTPADYGVIGLLNNLNYFLVIIMMLGLENAVPRWYWEHEGEEWRKSVIITWLAYYIMVNLFVGTLLFLFSKTISRLIVDSESIYAYIRILAITLPLQSLLSIVWQWLRLKQKALQLITLSLVSTLGLIGLNYLLVYQFRWGLEGFYYSYLAYSAIVFIWSFIILAPLLSLKYIKVKLLKEMVDYSLPLLPGGVGFYLILLIGIYFVQNFGGTTESGLYQLGSNISSGMALFVNAFAMAWVPFAMSIYKEVSAKETYAKVLVLYAVITGILFISVSFFVPEFLVLFTNAKFYDAGLTAALLSISYVIIGLIQVASIGLSIEKLSKPYGFIMTLAALAGFALNFLMVPLWGRLGAALANVIPLAISAVYLFYQSQQAFYVPYNFRLFGIIYVSALGLGLGGYWLFRHLPLTIWQLLGIKLGVFVLLLVLFGWWVYQRYVRTAPAAASISK